MRFLFAAIASFALGSLAIGINDPAAAYAIRNTIETYPLLVDGKNFDRFPEIFTKDLKSDYGEFGSFNNVSALADKLQKLLAPVATHHALSTQVINIYRPDRANVTTYVVASHFGVGSKAGNGQIYQLYSSYRDLLRPEGDTWKIYDRVAYEMGSPQGATSIFGN